MKLSAILFRQHIGWHFSKHWAVQGRKKPIATGAADIIKNRNIPVFNPADILNEKKPFEKIDVIGFKEKPQPLDQTHPDWHDEILYSYKDNNVLLEGLTQAKVITNTVEIQEGLPQIACKNVGENVHEFMKKIILNSHVFDAEQQKLPKIKDPERPAWNFPRSYGITQNRKNLLMVSKLLQLVESLNGQNLSQNRYLFSDLLFSYPFKREEQLVQFQVIGDLLLTASSPLAPITNEPTGDLELPDIFPLEPTVSLNKENIYKIEDIYPIKKNVVKSHPHTLFVYFNKEEVKNLYEEEVIETQILGRSLMKTFTVAASYAKQQYGDEVNLPKPVTVQCVQTDGQFFHFGVLQLNTLNLTEMNVKNVWYQTPLIYLFDKCKYETGKPVLEGYNSEVINQLNSLYNNE